MNWIKNSAVVMSSLIFALVAAEIIFRIFNIGYGNAPAERSHTYHHIHPSDFSFLMYDPYGEFGGYVIYYDESGYRVSNPSLSTFQSEDAENAIVFMGDSFTEAKQVHFEESFPSILGEQLDVPIMNLGVASYSPVIYQVQAQNLLQSVAASLVVLQIYSNDFEGDSKYLEFAEHKDNTLVAINGGNKNNLIRTLARSSYLVRFVRKSQLVLEKMLTTESIDIDALSIEQNVSQDDLLQTSDVISEIKAILDKNSKQLAVFMIPSKALSRTGECCKEDEIYARFMEQMRLRNIHTLDVSSYFERSPNQQDLFFELDIHLTKEGHSVLAEALLAELKAAGFL